MNDRSDILYRREACFEGQVILDPERLMFVDASCASMKLARRYGRYPRGEHLRMAVLRSYRNPITLAAGMRGTGMVTPS